MMETTVSTSIKLKARREMRGECMGFERALSAMPGFPVTRPAAVE
jgi:hypothetical protein